MYKDSKWAAEIISAQDEEGKWGWFHTLSQFYPSSITTEQALRRLYNLGFRKEDECVKKALCYMDRCLKGEIQIPDRREKIHDWDIFTSLMLSTWIRIFTEDNEKANDTAKVWGGIITYTFCGGTYSFEKYKEAYISTWKKEPKGGRLIDFCHFYIVSILAGALDIKTQNAFIDYVINKEEGIYYIYSGKIKEPPQVFQSKKASRYLTAAELLARYKNSGAKLQFITKWLMQNRQSNGKWDMGSFAADKIYFPLSDNWRKKENRENDCTARITSLIEKLSRREIL